MTGFRRVPGLGGQHLRGWQERRQACADPLVCGEPAATYERASNEHGRLAISAATNRLPMATRSG
jgi:hypothetical protein